MQSPTTEHRPKHKEEAVPQTPLDAKAEALAQLLRQALADLHPDVGGVLGEVVVTAQPDKVLEMARRLKEHLDLACDFLWCLSVVDYQDRYEVVYHVRSLSKGHHFVVKASVVAQEPHLPSVISVWPGADWYEREAHDLFGVVFDGHPNLAPLLLYEGFEGYPGRRSFPFHEYEEW